MRSARSRTVMSVSAVGCAVVSGGMFVLHFKQLMGLVGTVRDVAHVSVTRVQGSMVVVVSEVLQVGRSHGLSATLMWLCSAIVDRAQPPNTGCHMVLT